MRRVVDRWSPEGPRPGPSGDPAAESASSSTAAGHPAVDDAERLDRSGQVVAFAFG